jgi:hypothetical protein
MIIRIPRIFVKLVLYFTSFFNDNKIILVCKGYNEDYENYTGLYFEEDKEINSFDDIYEDFQLWIY